MFFTIALSIWVAMNAYVIWRVAVTPAITRVVPRWAIVVAGVFLACSFIAARLIEAHVPRGIGVALEWIGAEWMGTVFIALVCCLAADAATGFGWFMPDRAPTIRAWAIACAALLALFATLNALRPPVVRDYEVSLEHLPADRDGMVVVAISDLHLGTFIGERWLAARVAQIDALHPDIVFILGDLAEGDGPAEREIPKDLARLHAPLGVWAVPGNHELHSGGGIDALARNAGIRLLRDAWAEPGPGLVVGGVDMVGHRAVPGRGLVEKALAGRPEGAATILLSHAPTQVDVAAASGVGLMLSGHTHGGQIWPFNWFVRMSYRYIGGRYDVDGISLIVCRGTGTWGPRMRLWRPSEMLRITLRRESPRR